MRNSIMHAAHGFYSNNRRHGNHTTLNTKQNNKHEVSGNDSQLAVQRSSRHRRKHSSSRNRCVSKNKDTSSIIENDSKILSPKIKHKRHIEGYRSGNQTGKLDAYLVSTPESGFMEHQNEKESIVTKYKIKADNLEGNLEELHSKYTKLQESFEKKESEYNELYIHHEELIKHVEVIEQDRKNLASGYKKLSTENTQLNEDVSLLKILIYRLNVQLERYQDKLRVLNRNHDDSTVKNMDDVDSTSESKKISESWGRVNIHALGPLLEAYEESINEKEDFIKQFREECDNFGGKFKDIVAENQELRKDVEYYKSQIDKFTLEMKVLVDDAVVIKKENDILTKQAELQKQKLHEIHSIYEKKVESMSQDNNKLHENYSKTCTELSNLQGKYEILSDGYEKLKKNSEKTMPVSVHTDAIEECKKLFEELKNQYTTEKNKLLGQLKKYEETNPGNEKIIATLTAERDHLKQLTRNLEKNLKRTQHKLETIQNLVYSIQVSRDSFKRQLAKTTLYCEELVNEQEKLVSEKENLLKLLHKREKENESIKYLGTSIAHRMGTLKNQLKDVQKGAQQQLETVEKHIKIQKVGVGQLKSDYHRELSRLKNLVKQKEDVIGQLQREKFVTQDNLELIWKAATNDDEVVKNALKHTKVSSVQI